MMKKIKIKNNIFKKILILILLLMLLFFTYKIVIQTYSIFHSEATGAISGNISNWTILVNETNISSGVVQKFVINQINVSSNANVKPGKIAPGLSGDFKITINPTNTNVSIKYDIQIDDTKLKNNKIKVISVQEVKTNNILVKTAANVYTGCIPLDAIKLGTINEIKVTLQWQNDELSNIEDTNIGMVANSKIEIPITVRVSQYLGEQIIEYTK